MHFFRIVGAMAGLSSLWAQSAVDLKTQSKNVDFSTASHTKPFQLGPTRPANCMVGEAFFQTGVPAGQNLFLCTTANTWTQQTGGAQMFTDLKDCQVVLAGSTATVLTPCAIRIGGVVHSLTGNPVLTLSGTSSSGTVYVYWNSQGVLVGAENSSATLSCAPSCTSVSGNGFPLGSTPVASIAFSSNLFTAVSDFRSLTSTRNIVCGVGLLCSENPVSGEFSVDTDTAATLLTKAAFQSGQNVRCVSTSVSSTHNCSLSPSLWTYSNGMALEFVATAAALSGPATVNVDGLGAKAIKRADGVSDPLLNEIPAGRQVALRYDGIVFRLADAWAERSLSGTAAGIPACSAAGIGALYLFTDSLYSHARCDGSAWTYFYDGRSVTPPGDSWSWDNQIQNGSAVIDTTRLFHLLTVPSTHNTGYAIRYQAAPNGSYSRTFAIRWRASLGENSAGYMIGFRDSSGKLHGINIHFDSAVNGSFYLLDVRRQASAATVSVDAFDFPRTAVPHLAGSLYFRISDDTTNINFSYSADGYDFHTLFNGPRNSYLSAPTQIFFGAAARGAVTGASLDVISIQ